MIGDASCYSCYSFCYRPYLNTKFVYFTVSSNNVPVGLNKQHGRLLIGPTYDVLFSYNTASQPCVIGVVIDLLNIN